MSHSSGEHHRLSESDYLSAAAAGSTKVVGAAVSAKGIWTAESDGEVSALQGAIPYGDESSTRLSAPIIGITATSDLAGYWLLGADGGVFSFGDATFYGSTGGMALNAHALGLARARHGYWIVAADGGVFSFGDAAFYGSTGSMRLRAPVVAIASTPDAKGYWLLGADGGVFSFGDAAFYGSAAPYTSGNGMSGMVVTPDGHGYWIFGKSGAVYAFGDATYFGNAVNQMAGASAVSLVATADGAGYWIFDSAGGEHAYGDATPVASAGVSPPAAAPYTLERTNSAGQPVRWNPCDVIDYAVLPAGAPRGWQDDVDEAISQVSAATGLHLVDVGAYAGSSEVPAGTEITLSWVPSLTGGDYIGLTTYYYIFDSRWNPQMTGASVELLSSLGAGFTGTSTEGPVLLHELGHAVGLGHTPGEAQVMNPYDQGFGSYQPGDLAGLHRVGAAEGCSGFYK